ncbi:MAG TPA: hypothetical protein VGC16_06270 [Rhizomicrobium sp.]
MSNSSDTARMLDAIARECSAMAGEIAWLGAQVSSEARGGSANIVAMQNFDYLAQQADAQASLIARLAAGMTRADEMRAAIAAIPLPLVRARLLAALAGRTAAAALPDDDIFWPDP